MIIDFGAPVLWKDLEEGHAFILDVTSSTVYKKTDRRYAAGFAMKSWPFHLNDMDEVFPIVEVKNDKQP